METKDTKNNWDAKWNDKWKALSTKKKVLYIVGLIVATQVLGAILTLINPAPNPCDCADVASKAEIIGYDNLNSKQQKLYRRCEDVYYSSAEAYNACIDKHK